MERNTVSSWAVEKEIPVLWPEDYLPGLPDPDDPSRAHTSLSPAKGFRGNPCIDYGKFIRKIPSFVLRPSNLEQLRSSVIFLNENRVPFKLRGTGHSSGGQVLIDGGAVIDLRYLNRILEDRPGMEEIRVEAGAWWFNLVEFLYPQRRRPAVLTDNIRTTVGGTLAVGGFGDTTHLYGLQISCVSELKFMDLEGKIHAIDAQHPLFGYILAGRGQLGIITEVTVQTLKRSSIMTGRLLKWRNLPDFYRDALRMIENKHYEYFRARILYKHYSPTRNPVAAVGGHFTSIIPNSDPALEEIRPVRFTPWEQLDLYKLAMLDPLEKWRLCSPSIEMVFPLPHGLDVWPRINEQIIQSGLYRSMPRGSSILMLKKDPRFPIAPYPNSEYCMMISVRPPVDLAGVKHYWPVLQDMGSQALKAGGKIYLMSIELECPDFLSLQFGEALPQFIRLKNEMDPQHILNPGLLDSASHR